MSSGCQNSRDERVEIFFEAWLKQQKESAEELSVCCDGNIVCVRCDNAFLARDLWLARNRFQDQTETELVLFLKGEFLASTIKEVPKQRRSITNCRWLHGSDLNN